MPLPQRGYLQPRLYEFSKGNWFDSARVPIRYSAKYLKLLTEENGQ